MRLFNGPWERHAPFYYRFRSSSKSIIREHLSPSWEARFKDGLRGSDESHLHACPLSSSIAFVDRDEKWQLLQHIYFIAVISVVERHFTSHERKSIRYLHVMSSWRKSWKKKKKNGRINKVCTRIFLSVIYIRMPWNAIKKKKNSCFGCKKNYRSQVQIYLSHDL